MSKISAKAVMQLRERTCVSMMACKKALVEANGDEEKAIEILRKSGVAKAAKKADRSTGEGAIAISGKAIVKLNCETDFVAKNDDFKNAIKEIAETADSEDAKAAEDKFEAQKADLIAKLGENITFGGAVKAEKEGTVGSFVHFNNKNAAVVVLDGGREEVAKDIAMHVVASNPEVLSPEEIDDALVAKEKEIWKDELAKSGKPENIIENIMKGKENKFRGEKALKTQPFVKDDKKTVAEYAKDNGAEVIEFVALSV